ncbi:MAG TPA: 5'/3'-nucleotidase SurE [candidate division Zixibacteria bacterium]|nr:5'/3'-nucleotidase SurE [candidate division Zixibacteria bacterium]
MAILVTNDDGIYAPGLEALAAAMSEIDEVFVIAPDREQSAVGHAITLSSPLRITHIERECGFTGYATSGTPADAVKLGIKSLMQDLPDLVISGINLGANVGASLIYSGTVSAATEGCLLGVPSIAISLDSRTDGHWETAAEFAKIIARDVLAKGLPEGILLNVNVPDLPRSDVKGVMITSQGKTNFNDFFEERMDPRGQRYYWMCGTLVADDERRDHDVRALADGYISVTPVHYNLTAHKFLGDLSNWELDKNWRGDVH